MASAVLGSSARQDRGLARRFDTRTDRGWAHERRIGHRTTGPGEAGLRLAGAHLYQSMKPPDGDPMSVVLVELLVELLVVVLLVLVVFGVLVVVVEPGFFSAGTQSSRRWISLT